MRLFLLTIMNGLTLAALYFLVASGFTLVFGLMRNVNLAHGSLYLLGGYLGYGAVDVTGYWLLAFPVVFILVGALGLLLQHQVGQHDRYADRDKRLAQFLPLHAPKHLVLQQEAERADQNEHDRKCQQPVAGEVNRTVTDVAAQKVKRTMGEVDIAHQPEHQREARRDQEIKRSQRNARQDRVEKDPLAAHGLLETRRPRRNDQPYQTDDEHKDHDGPDRMARAEVLQGTHATSSCHMLVDRIVLPVAPDSLMISPIWARWKQIYGSLEKGSARARDRCRDTLPRSVRANLLPGRKSQIDADRRNNLRRSSRGNGDRVRQHRAA